MTSKRGTLARTFIRVALVTATSVALVFTGWGAVTPAQAASCSTSVQNRHTATASGTAKVGQTLNATLSVSSGTIGTATGYTWYSGSTVISGATAASYSLTAADAGQTIKVAIAVKYTSWGSSCTFTKTSAATAAVASGDLTAPTPTISGTAKVGATLTAVPGGWNPGTATLTYQWNRGGTAISGATSASYVATTTDLNASLTVSVTGVLTGYTTVTKTSAATAAVANGDLTTVVPIISGTTKVGSTLTAIPGAWSPATTTFAYQWYRGSTAISGAVAATYTLVAADAGAAVKVNVTGSATAYTSTTVSSAATAAVGNGTYTTVAPTVSGTAKVGSTLTAAPGTWTPVPSSGYTYAWLRDGAAIVGATSSTHTLTTSDAGRAISVQVSGTGTGYDPASATSAAIGVASGTITTATPTISGTVQVGKVLTAATGTWSPMPSSFTYAWLRDGVAIVGATSSTYTLVAADQGAAISVQLSGAVTGYDTATVTSVATAAVAAGTITTVKPTISGTAQVGQQLTAGVAGWSPMPSGFTYAWLRGGTAISGATASTYTLVAADQGAAIAVRVTGSVAGYTAASVTSDATATVVVGTFTAGTPVISGNASLGSTLTVAEGTWTPAPDSFAYSWLRNGVTISGATASTYTLVNADVSAKISVQVTATRAGFTSLSVTSAQTASVGAGAFTAGVPTLSGWPAVGSQLTATAGTWTPAPDSYTYAWLRDGVAISGATSLAYTLVAADQGHLIGFRVTATKTGFIDGTATTNLSSAIGAGTFSSTGSATISGTAKVGVPVTAVPPAWTPAPTTSTYQWYAAGLAIPGATAVSYTPVASDVTKALTVTITAKRDGYTDAIAT